MYITMKEVEARSTDSASVLTQLEVLSVSLRRHVLSPCPHFNESMGSSSQLSGTGWQHQPPRMFRQSVLAGPKVLVLSKPPFMVSSGAH